jgi:hypothetical protein
MKNKLSDLNNHLFAQLERLNDETLSGDQLQDEIERSKAITGVSKEVVSNARLVLDAERHKREYGLTSGPKMLE